MTKQEAEAYMRGEKTLDQLDSQPVETHDSNSPVDNTTSTATETATVENTSGSSEEESVVSSDVRDNLEKVEPGVENKPKKSDNSKSNPSKGYTPEQKQKHAFMKEKNKRKEALEQLARKQKEIEELQAKLKKYEGLTRENFKGDDDAYTEYKIDRRFDQERVSRLKNEYNDEYRRAQMEESEQIAAERIQTNYPDEKERNQYQNLVMRAEQNFAQLHPEIGYNRFSEFLMSEPDRTILQYLHDSDNSPKLINHFIRKPEAALKIMNMRNPYNKIVELKQLENRMLQHERIVRAKGKTLVQEKRSIPNTGKIVTNTNTNQPLDFDRPWTKAEAEQYLRNRHR